MTTGLASFRAHLARTYRQAVRARAELDDASEIGAPQRAQLAVAATVDDTDTPMYSLAQRLALSQAQVELTWAIVACSVDARIVPHLESLGGVHARRGLSLDVYARLAELDDESAAALTHWLASDDPLVAAGLVVASETASPAARTYVASSRLVSYLSGDDRVAAPLRVVALHHVPLHDDVQRAVIDELREVLARDAAPVLAIEGPVGSGRATAVASASGCELVILDCARCAGDQLADALVALRAEVLLRPCIPVLADVDQILSEERPELRLVVGRFVDHHRGPLIVTASVPGIDIGTRRALARIPWDVCADDVRVELWRRAVATAGHPIDGELAELAHRYRVGPAAIDRAVETVHLLHAPDAPIGATALAAGLRHNIAEQLAGLAARVEVTQSWNDLVVVDDVGDMIAALVGRIRHAHQVLDRWGYRKKIARGTGVAALFSGPPGTGKTMVAGLIARELDLELYQVDLSKVVSKWIGETEKNLARVFDAAESGHALLLFDEADALFGQRSSGMRGAVDRYANLEVNYLLHRVEAFGGITILTTNLESAIDAALKRRLAAHIVFTAPDEDERARLWSLQIATDGAPLATDIDADKLAREFPAMTGANIRNAAIAGAFLAASDGAGRIAHEHLARAARAEYRSMGHMVSEAFGRRR